MQEQLGARIPLIVDGGRTPRSMHSTIVDLSQGDGQWQVIREGAVPVQQITELLN